MPVIFAIIIAAVLTAVEITIWCHRRGWVPVYSVVSLAGFGLMMIGGFAFAVSGMAVGVAASGG